MTALEATQTDKVAVLATILRRNALRRKAHLPLLDVLTLYHKELAYRRSWAVYDAHFPAIHDQVVEQLTAERGSEFIRTRSGAWRIHVEATRLLHERFPIRRPQQRV